jgi:hypothetical protein
MDLVHKMMARNSQEFAEEMPLSTMATAMETDEKVTVNVLRWKRVVMMTGVTINHALTGSIIAFLETMRNEHAAEALKEYKRVAGKNALKIHTTKTSTATSLKATAKGKALTPSKTKQYPLEPANCTHPEHQMSKPRGGPGKSAWLTCLECGSRWERIVPPTQAPPAQGVLRRVPNENLSNPMQIEQERLELAMEELVKDQYSKEFLDLHAMFLNYKGSGMLTPVQCVQQMLAGCSTENQIVAVNAYARLHVKTVE